MFISDISVKRPVLASVIGLLLIIFGAVSFDRLPLREYPDIDPPVISVDTTYPGASASIVETRITEIVEERIAGIEGIVSISSTSSDGRSSISIEFDIDRDIDSAANDIRDRVSGIVDNLPDEADPPEVQKADSNQDVIMWLNLSSAELSVPEITDYARRYLVDRFSVLDGVARVRVGGAQDYAMRIWLDRAAMAARGLTVSDVERALRDENVELPAGAMESVERQLNVRVARTFRTPNDFSRIAIASGDDGKLVRLGDIARVEKGTVEDRTFFRGNQEPMVGIGIIKQSDANTIEVARAARETAKQVNTELSNGLQIYQSYDESVFIEGAISEVYKTLFFAIGMVILVIFLFLGSVRAMLVPAVTVPISIIATFSMLLIFDFSINLLTLLALVLAIGLVVDDAIVVLENIVRRINTYNEPPLLAAYRGARQVGFAVVATTVVLISVFVPISFLEGDVGRLFSEFAITMAVAVAFSSLVALSLSTTLASKFLSKNSANSKLVKLTDSAFEFIRRGYHAINHQCLRFPVIVVLLYGFVMYGAYWLYQNTPTEYAPSEDRGVFFIIVNGPEGASFEYISEYMTEIEQRLMPYVESKEINRLLVRAPRSFGNIESFNSGIVISVMNDWSQRRNAFTVMNEIRGKLADLPGVRAFPVMRQGFGGRTQKPVQFVLGGGTYEQLAEWRDTIVAKVNENNPGLEGLSWDYKETQPQLEVTIDYDRAASLGVTVSNIGRTLETMLGSRRVTTYIDEGREYDVLIEGEPDQQRTPLDMQNIYVRSDRSGELIPLSNVISVKQTAVSGSLNRYNRVRAITLEANLSEGYTLGEALTYLNGLVDDNLPETVIVNYKGQSLDYQTTGASVEFVFLLGVLITFLVLAAQFESWIHPFVIILTVPVTIAGGLLGLHISGGTLNIYSQIGLLMLVGLAAKNGILIVEFINQLRDQGMAFKEAIITGADIRLRPILMTGVTTTAGTLPLILSSGAGAETRYTIGTVVLYGVVAATLLTVFIVPTAYNLLTRRTGSPNAVTRELEEQESKFTDK